MRHRSSIIFNSSAQRGGSAGGDVLSGLNRGQLLGVRARRKFPLLALSGAGDVLLPRRHSPANQQTRDLSGLGPKQALPGALIRERHLPPAADRSSPASPGTGGLSSASLSAAAPLSRRIPAKADFGGSAKLRRPDSVPTGWQFCGKAQLRGYSAATGLFGVRSR